MHSENILYESTEAYKFVNSLRRNISRCRADNSYPTWSNRFLEFCEHNAEATLKYIEKPREFGIEIDEVMKKAILSIRLPSIIKGWELLHAFIKPVLDANTLRVPNSFIHFLSQHIGSLNAVKGSNIVVELIPQFNYLQHRHTSVRHAMLYLKKTTKSIDEVPKVGFLGLPFSQSESLFLNCILFHEAAHFIAEEAKVFPDTAHKDLAKQLEPDFHPYENWAGKKIITWMEELFADIVAVKLLGPAYTLAYIKLLQLAYNLSKEEIRSFEVDHPADALRIREQFEILKKDCWKQYLYPTLWTQLEEIAKIKQKDYLPPKKDDPSEKEDPKMQKVWRKLIEFLCSQEQIDNIHKLANKWVEDRYLPLDLYAKSYEGIRECLEHGIVPSANNTPHPIAIINEVVFFLLSGMDELYKIIANKQKIDRGKPSGRALLEQRVEMWSMKAIEDWIIINNQKITNSQKLVS